MASQENNAPAAFLNAFGFDERGKEGYTVYIL